MPDLLTFGATDLRLSPPRDHRLETARRLRAQADGPESNAAVAAGRLGVDAAWVSTLPDTALGRRVAGELREQDVDVRVRWADAADGRQGLRFVEQAGAPRGPATVEDRAGAAVEGHEGEAVPAELLSDSGVVYVTGATAARSTTLAGATAKVLRGAAEAGAMSAFGLRYEPAQWDSAEVAGETLREFFPAVDAFVADRADVAATLDRSGQPAEVAHGLASAWEFETVALRREGAAVVWHDATVHEYAVPETDVVDEAGARDAFAGAFLAALVEGRSPRTALARAVAADALARTVHGPLPTVSATEVDRVAAAVTDRD